MSGLFECLLQALANEERVALATLLDSHRAGSRMLVWKDGRSEGDLGDAVLTEAVRAKALEVLEAERPERVSLSGEDGERDVFFEVFAPPPVLLIVGAVHLALPLISIARILGFRTRVIDPRSVFATPERFAEADELIREWPLDVLGPADLDEQTYVVILSHDEKIDNPALGLALKSACRYIGALGSRKTQQRRRAALLEMGFSEAEMERIHAPIGLDLGAGAPEEIALSIAAEIIMVRNRGQARPAKQET